ncbi:MAG: CotH kinase family protein [Myxococcota bacterium]
MTPFLVLACAEPESHVIAPDGPRVVDEPADTAAEVVEGRDSATETVEDVGSQDTTDLDAVVFDDTIVHRVEIELEADATAALDADPYEWVPGTITYDGVELKHVGVRLRGKIGSYRTLSGKPKFKIGFNEYNRDQRLYGLEEISLNNSVVDCSYLKEPMAWKVFEQLGVPHLRTAFAWVWVNGTSYGLYQVVETPNDVWLDRHWEDGSGNFYDGKYVWYGGYSYTLLDFGIGVDGLFQLEEGTDVGNADVVAVSDALLASKGTADYYAAMDTVLDWEAFHRMVVGEVLVGHLDGYSMNTNNFRVYFDPADGRAHVVPWDMDYTFLEDWQWGMNWRTPRGQITAWCYADDTCRAAQADAFEAHLGALDTDALLAEFDALADLTYDATQLDPRRECAATDVAGSRTTVRDWIAGRVALLRAAGM